MPETPKHVIHGGRYALYERVGAGQFGEVWRARDLLQEDPVAVKLLGPKVEVDAALLETRLLTRLRAHERVVTIRNVELAPPVPFIVTDYLPAGSVEQRLRMGVVTMLDAVRWTRDALDGLAHAHALGVIHRDVKPGNLLLDGHQRAVLSDFGIAEDTVNDLLAVPEIYLPHQAPEQHDHGSSVKTDIWATGCTLYRLLTGRYPFQTLADAASGTFVAPHHINPQVPMALTRVVQRALAVDPADRFHDAVAMLAAVMEPNVRHHWTRVSDPQALESWEATTPDGLFRLRVVQSRRGEFEVAITRDKGSGPRHIVREKFTARSVALRVRRNRLLQLVSSGTVVR